MIRFPLVYAGENALPCFDIPSFQQIVNVSKGIAGFTYLRLGPDLMNSASFVLLLADFL